jgi:hypothetical protein
MQTSESVANIFKAIIQAQSEFTPAVKDATNPHFRSKYANFDSIVDTIRPVLAKNGLAFMQPTVDIDGKLFIKTRIIHGSGEWIESSYPVNPVKNDPQGYGSALTYARRYSLSSILGITSDEDDDGNKSSHPPQQKAYQPQIQKPQSPPAEVKIETPITTIPSKELPPNLALGVYVMKSGKYSGRSLYSLSSHDLKLFIANCSAHELKIGHPLPEPTKEDLLNIKQFLGINL